MTVVPPPPRDPRGTRHSMSTVRKARLLFQNGWTIREIQTLLARDLGKAPAKETVQRWVYPGYADYHRRVQNERRRQQRQAGARRRPGPKPAVVSASDELLWALRVEDGLSYPAIAAVVRRFFGDDVNENQVRHRIAQLGAPKNPNKVRQAARNFRLGVAA